MLQSLPSSIARDSSKSKAWRQPPMTVKSHRKVEECKIYKTARIISLQPDPEQLRYMRLFARSGINCT
eukprot:scaffold9663_cov31-Tisochrysis_lutea.AAC.2